MRTLAPSYTYVIVTGDTLSHIAEEFGSSVEELMAFNPTIEDCNMIFPGQVLKMPTHCIQKWLAGRGIDSPAVLASNCVEMSHTIADLRARVDELNKERDRAYDGFEGQGRRLYELCLNAGAQPGNVKSWLAELIEKLDRPLPAPNGYQLVPKLLNGLMASRIRQAADSRRFESWPANCWEHALDVAPVPVVTLREAIGFPPARKAKVVPIPDAELSMIKDGAAIPIETLKLVGGCRGEPGLEHRWVNSTGGHNQQHCSKCGVTQGPELSPEEKLAWIAKFTESFR